MTTINNSENLIEKVGGIEKAREIVSGAPEGASHCRQTVFGNFIYYKFENGELFCWVIDNWFLSSNQEYKVISTQNIRTAIAKNDTTDIGAEIDSFLDAFKSPELTDERKEELTQDWKGMSGGVAFSLIERHADNWKEIDYMMNQWLEANKGTERHG